METDMVVDMTDGQCRISLSRSLINRASS